MVIISNARISLIEDLDQSISNARITLIQVNLVR